VSAAIVAAGLESFVVGFIDSANGATAASARAFVLSSHNEISFLN
jgi:hypothetical protein